MMFYDGNGGWHPWMLALMSVGMLLFWALVIWGAVFLFRRSGSGSRDSGQADPEQILKERLGRGEISTEE